MRYTVVGLGNPGIEYENTRHNAGRLGASFFESNEGFGGFQNDSALKSLISKGDIGKDKVTVLLPNTFMNNSGKVVKNIVTSEKSAERLIVIYDDIDLPFGMVRIAFNRGSGGHKGVESIIKHIKTKQFVRVRIGVSPTTPSGQIKKPKGEQKVYDFLLGEFTKKEREELSDIVRKVSDAVKSIIVDGRAQAMNTFNRNE